MKKVVDKFAIIYAVIALLLILVYWLAQGNFDLITIFSLTVFVMIPCIAAISAIMSLKESGRTWRSKYLGPGSITASVPLLGSLLRSFESSTL
jgi:hypothetical protein